MAIPFAARVHEAHLDRGKRHSTAAAEAGRVAMERKERHLRAHETTIASRKLAAALDAQFLPERQRVLIGHGVRVGPIIPGDPFRSSTSYPRWAEAVEEGWILTEKNHHTGATTPSTVETFGQPAEKANGLLLLRDGRVVTHSGYMMDDTVKGTGKNRKIIKVFRKSDDDQYIVTEHKRQPQHSLDSIADDGTLAIGATDPRIMLEVNRAVAARVSDKSRADVNGLYLDNLLANLAARAGIPPAVFI